MKMMDIGKSGIKVSVLALGTIAYGSAGGVQSAGEAERVLDKCLEAGLNYIDTAPVYGTSASENLLGQALGDRRSRFIIQTKCGLNWRDADGILEYVRDGKNVYRNLTPKSIRQDLEDSLRRLKTDYIDIFMTHRQSLTTPVEDTVRELEKMKKEGKIRAFGLSNAKASEMEEYSRSIQVDLVQQKYSILDQRFAETHFPLCREMGATYQAYGVLDHGGLTGTAILDAVMDSSHPLAARSVAFHPDMKPHMYDFFGRWEKYSDKYQCSIPGLIVRYTLAHFEHMNVLIGSNSMEELQDNCHAVSVEISDEDAGAMMRDVEELLSYRPDWQAKNPTNQ